MSNMQCTSSRFDSKQYCEFMDGVVIDFNKVQPSPQYGRYNLVIDKGFRIACESLRPKFSKMESKMGVGFWWGNELEHVSALGTTSLTPSILSKCNRHFTKPVFLLQTDFPFHIYHHFTSILNMWWSKHLAGLGLDPDVHIIFLDSFNAAKKVTLPPHSFLGTFSAGWYAMTKHPVLDRRHWEGETWCFDQAILSIPPRASLFYPTRGVSCRPSHIITSYIDLLLRNMTLHDLHPSMGVQVTFVHRAGKTRVLLNQDSLLAALREAHPSTTVTPVDFATLSFHKQLEVVRKTDVLVGMHGAGLTHVLFLPRQHGAVALVEVYNTMDEFCYKDLAKLSDVEYFTWDQGDTGSLHPTGELLARTAKMVNYAPDQSKFVRLVGNAIEHVQRNGRSGARASREEL